MLATNYNWKEVWTIPGIHVICNCARLYFKICLQLSESPFFCNEVPEFVGLSSAEWTGLWTSSIFSVYRKQEVGLNSMLQEILHFHDSIKSIYGTLIFAKGKHTILSPLPLLNCYFDLLLKVQLVDNFL